MLNLVLVVLHWLAALVVLLEAMNKLERCHPLEPGLSRRARVVVVLKAVAWILLALGAAGQVVQPALVSSVHRVGSWLLLDRPSVVDLLYAVGFAVLIVRSRLKEEPTGSAEP